MKEKKIFMVKALVFECGTGTISFFLIILIKNNIRSSIN